VARVVWGRRDCATAGGNRVRRRSSLRVGRTEGAGTAWRGSSQRAETRVAANVWPLSGGKVERRAKRPPTRSRGVRATSKRPPPPPPWIRTGDSSRRRGRSFFSCKPGKRNLPDAVVSQCSRELGGQCDIAARSLLRRFSTYVCHEREEAISVHLWKEA
jgi:hypothetical protein